MAIAESYKSNYMFENDQELVTIYWTISKKAVELPTLSETAYIYSGEVINVKIDGFDEKTMQIFGNSSATNANIYRFEIQLIDTTNYEWSDGTITPKTYTWSIVKSNAPLIIALSISGAVAIASIAGFTIYITRKKKKKKLKLKQVDEE